MHSSTLARPPAADGRQALLRVWMSISAVWLVFWAILTGAAAATLGLAPFPLAPISGMVLIPPLALLALGWGARLAFEALRAARRGSEAFH